MRSFNPQELLRTYPNRPTETGNSNSGELITGSENLLNPVVRTITVIWIEKETAEIKEVNYFTVLNKKRRTFPPHFSLPC